MLNDTEEKELRRVAKNLADALLVILKEEKTFSTAYFSDSAMMHVDRALRDYAAIFGKEL